MEVGFLVEPDIPDDVVDPFGDLHAAEGQGRIPRAAIRLDNDLPVWCRFRPLDRRIVEASLS